MLQSQYENYGIIKYRTGTLTERDKEILLRLYKDGIVTKRQLADEINLGKAPETFSETLQQINMLTRLLEETVSKPLNKLKSFNFITSSKNGKDISYTLTSDGLTAMEILERNVKQNTCISLKK